MNYYLERSFLAIEITFIKFLFCSLSNVNFVMYIFKDFIV